MAEHEHKADEGQTAGRKANGAITPEAQTPTRSDAAIQRNGEKSRRQAGPDGPDAKVVGDTFKGKAGK